MGILIETNVEGAFKGLVQIIDEVSDQNNILKGGKLKKM